VAVDKKVIYFDDSILERIKFIGKQQKAGKTLARIEELLQAELPDLENETADRLCRRSAQQWQYE